MILKIFLQEEETAPRNGAGSSDDESSDEKGMYDKAGKLKKMKHEQARDSDGQQVSQSGSFS